MSMEIEKDPLVMLSIRDFLRVARRILNCKKPQRSKNLDEYERSVYKLGYEAGRRSVGRKEKEK